MKAWTFTGGDVRTHNYPPIHPPTHPPQESCWRCSMGVRSQLLKLPWSSDSRQPLNNTLPVTDDRPSMPSLMFTRALGPRANRV